MEVVGHPLLESARPRLDLCGAAAQAAREQHSCQDVIRTVASCTVVIRDATSIYREVAEGVNMQQ